MNRNTSILACRMREHAHEKLALALAHIADALDGKVWDPDTLEAIAAEIRSLGADVREPMYD